MRKESMLLCAILAVAGASGCGRPAPPHTSVLLISIDTLRADALGSYGAPSGRTPHLDQLAQNGIVFENAISQAPATGPSFASILTSLYPDEHGVLASTIPLEDQHLTLAEIFRGAGYRTGAFVSTSILGSDYGFAQGFDVYDDKMHSQYAPNQHERDARFTTDRALVWLAEASEKPFFLWVHYFDAHAPYRAYSEPGDPSSVDTVTGAAVDTVTGAAVDTVTGAAVGNPSQAGSYKALRGIETRQSEQELAAALPEIRHLYAGEVAQIDQQIGRLIAATHDLGSKNRPLIAVGSDHGEELFDHGFFHGHAISLSESVLHVPLIFSLPGKLPAGQRIDALVENVDIFPTILSIAGLRPPKGGSGLDLSPLILTARVSGNEADPPNPSEPLGRLARSMREPYANMPGGHAIALRSDRWKTIFYTEAATKLYDLQSDSGERTNLASKQPERVAEFQSKLDDWLEGKSFTILDHADLDPDDYGLLKSLGYIQE